MPRWKSSGSARSGQSVIWTRWWRNCSMWFRRTRTSRLRRTMESCSVRMDISDTDRSITKKCGKCRLSNLPFHKRHFPHFFVIDRSVSEISILTEQLSMVRRNRDVRVSGNHIEQFLHHLVQITDCPDLALPELFHLGMVEKLFFALHQLAADHLFVQMLEYARAHRACSATIASGWDARRSSGSRNR